jgi:hypothetical protein
MRKSEKIEVGIRKWEIGMRKWERSLGGKTDWKTELPGGFGVKRQYHLPCMKLHQVKTNRRISIVEGWVRFAQSFIKLIEYIIRRSMLDVRCSMLDVRCSMFICFFFDLTVRSRPEATLTPETAAVLLPNIKLETIRYKHSLY